MIGQMSSKDLSKVAKIHLEVYGKEHFTSHFSHKMLVDYYSNLLQTSDCSLVSRGDDHINGFLLAGTRINDGVQHFISSNRVRILLVLLKNPKFLIDKLNQFLFPKEGYQSSAKLRLLSIAITKNAQGSTVAQALIHTLEETLFNKEIPEYGLSVKISNPRAIKFYEKMGLSIEHQQGNTIFMKKSISKDD